MKLTLDSTVVASTTLVSADIGEEEVILLHLGNGFYFGLQDVSARVWRLAQSPITVREIERILLEEYEIDSKRCHDEVLRLLSDLLDEGLVEVMDPGSGE